MIIGLKHDILKLLREQAPPAPSPTAAPAPPPAPTPEPPAVPASAPAAPADPNTPVDPNAPPPDPNAPVDPNTPADPNAPIDPNAPVDPNSPVDPNAPPRGASDEDGAPGEVGADPATDGQPENQPKISKDDPIGSIYDAAIEVAETTSDPQLILNSVKAGMQANFGSHMEDAWPLVQRLKDTENVVLGGVANRLSLFINGTIQENIKKGKRIMTANKERPANNFKITEAQLARIIKNTAKRLTEETMFDALKTQLDQERTDIESRMSGNEVKKMALEFFEKLCQKAGLDPASLTPQAKEYINKELETMVHSVQDVGAKLSHVARVINAAGKKTEGKG